MAIWDYFFKPKETNQYRPESYTGMIGGMTKAEKPQNWWERLTPWQEEQGETFGGEVGKLWGKITQPKPPAKTDIVWAGQGLAPTPSPTPQLKWETPPGGSPTLYGAKEITPTDIASAGMKKPTDLSGYGLTPLVEKPKAKDWILDYPDQVEWLKEQGISPQQIATMTTADYEKFAGEFSAKESQKQYEESQKRGYQWYWGPEATEQRRKTQEQQEKESQEREQRERAEYWSPEESTQRQRQFEESQQRQNQWYWSPQEVEQRRRQREESETWQEQKANEGWTEYFGFLEALKLSPEANNYFDNPTQFAELRRRWRAEGGGTPWIQWLQSQDLMSDWYARRPAERGERVATFTPRMKQVSQL